MSESKLYVSPIGTLLFGALHEPSFQFNEQGDYFAVMTFSPKEAEALMDRIDLTLEGYRQANAIASRMAKLLPYRSMVDEDRKETGDYSFKFSLKAKVLRESKEPLTFKPILFDASAHQILTPVGKGSTLKIAYTFRPWCKPGVGYGLSLRLHAAQIMTLVEPISFQKNAAYYGFTPLEGQENA